MSEFLNTKELAGLLQINEKKVYALASEGKIPGTMITGKWLFPRKDVEEYIRKKSRETIRKFSTEYILEKDVILAAGSDDPLLALAYSRFHRAYRDYCIYSASVGSREGLHQLQRSYCHMAFSHLYDFDADDFNFSFIDELGLTDDVVVINFFYRDIGFLSREKPVLSISQVVDEKLRFINRQKDSGIRNLINSLLEQSGARPGQIQGYDNEVNSHYEIGIALAGGQADTGIASRYTAHLLNLTFSFLLRERFDIVIAKDIFPTRPVQAFIEFIRSDEFMSLVSPFPGYDFSRTGRIMYRKK